MDFLSAIVKIVGENNVISNEMMSVHTTLRVGGPAKYFVLPQDILQIGKCIDLAKNNGIEYTVIGNGSNILVSDDGYDGMIIRIGGNLSSAAVEGNLITADAGISLAMLFNKAKEYSLKGLEFAAGIPGTLGGACFMNAGAYGGEMKDVLLEVTAMDANGTVRTYLNSEMELGYRSSVFQKNGDIILSAKLCLEKGNIEEITLKAAEYAKKRCDRQPLEYPSAGSTFKRPEGFFAGALIEKAGLKGCGTGGAEVSEKHAGFVINKNGATADDIFKTIMMVIEKVKEDSGIVLEPEVRLIGNFQDTLD